MVIVGCFFVQAVAYCIGCLIYMRWIQHRQPQQSKEVVRDFRTLLEKAWQLEQPARAERGQAGLNQETNSAGTGDAQPHEKDITKESQ